MARGWHYTKLSLSTALLLSLACALCYCSFIFVVFVLFCSYALAGAFCKRPSDIFLSCRPRSTGLATRKV